MLRSVLNFLFRSEIWPNESATEVDMNATLPYSQLQENLDATCNEVCRNHAPVVVERQNGNIVIVAQEDYLSLIETTYLLKSPANAERLLKSLNNRDNDICFNSVDDIKAQLNLI